MKSQWEPQYADFDERPVELSREKATTSNASGNDLGILIQQPTEKYAGDGAVFWIDVRHLYLRYSWNLWYPIATDDANQCLALGRRHTATLTLCDGASASRHSLRVFHVDRLPERLFDTPPADDGEPPPSADADMGTERELLAEKVTARGGCRIASARPGLFPVDVYELNGHLVCANFFRPTGDWLADETPLLDDWPLWFGESAQDVSPVAAALVLREQIGKAVPGVPVVSLVVLKPSCTVINERDMRETWAAFANLALVRNAAADGSEIARADDALDAIAGASRPRLKSCADVLETILSGFNPQPKCEM